MPSVQLKNVSVDFVVYQSSGRSLRRALLAAGKAVGGLTQDSQHRTVVRALHDVTLDLRAGDRVALIGGNGAGKTTLLRTLAGIYEPTAGSLRVEGRTTPLFDLSLGLDMDASGYENIRLQAAYFGLDRAAIDARIDDIAAFTELGEYLNLPVRTYSAGMRLRLAFATATEASGDILLLDEWLAVSDSRFLERAQRRAEAFIERAHILVAASHIEGVLLRLCNKALLLEHGAIIAAGSVEEIIERHHKMG